MDELNVQKYLRSGKTVEDLTAELGIVVVKHPTKPLMILNYDQIDSPKTDLIVRECRGLVLRSDTFDLVAKAFDRFFNWGEVIDEQKDFNFSDFAAYEKVDGSLVLIYFFEGELMINTRGSFAQGILEGSDKTWEQNIREALGEDVIQRIQRGGEGCTLVCEFCSLYNKVVRTYRTPTVYLLSIFVGDMEQAWETVDENARWVGLPRPIRYEFTSIEQVEKFVREIADTDKTFEGIVIVDRQGHRWKLKNPTYLALHRLKGNGNVFLVKNLVPFVLSGEAGELLAVYPEATEKYKKCEDTINAAYEALKTVFLEHKGIEDQKTFALAIKGKTPFTGILFTLKKQFGAAATEKQLRELWRQSEDGILKLLFE